MPEQKAQQQPVVEVVQMARINMTMCSATCFFSVGTAYGCSKSWATPAPDRYFAPGPDCPGPGRYKLVRIEDD